MKGDRLPVSWTRTTALGGVGIRLSMLLLLGARIANSLHGQTIAEFSVPMRVPLPGRGGVFFLGSIAAGPDGALWFTESLAGQIGRITANGAITEYPAAGTPYGI